ncbi:MAG: roadblock/LC7 domain-containing protein [Candidatus Odinarchaeia archaeon]
MTSKIEEIENILREIELTTRHIEACAVISTQGLPISSAMPANVNDEILSAMAAAILSIGERAAIELSRGKLNRILVEGEKGYLILKGAGENAILAVLTTKSANLGMVFLIMERAADRIMKLL